MPEFTDLEIDADIDELGGNEAKKTLAEFVEKHKQNREAYDELQTDFEQKVSQYEEELSEYEEKLEDLTFERAEQAAEHVNMPADLIADRFSLDEIDQIIDEATEHSEEPEEDDEDRLTQFDDRPAKGDKKGSDYREKYREEAKEMLRQHGASI